MAMMAKEAVEAEAYPQPVNLTEVSREWLASYVKQCKTEWSRARREKDGKAAFAYKVLNKQDVHAAHHFIVEPEYRHHEGTAATYLDKWALNTRNYLMPSKSKWLELKEEDEDLKLLANACREIVWEILNEDGVNFRDMARDWICRSASTFGGAVRVSYDEDYDENAERAKPKPCFTYYDFDQFVIDPNGGKDGNIIFTKRFSRADLKRMSRPVTGEDGTVIRGPVFDPKAVEQVLMGSHMEEPSGDYGKARDNGSEAAETEYWDALEFVGNPVHPDIDLPENQIITVIGSTVLRAIDNPRDYKTWALFGYRDSRTKDPYPESVGFELAAIETEVNRVKTLAAAAMAAQVMGVWKWQVGREKDVKKYGRFFSLRPGMPVPDVFEQMNYKVDFSPVQMAEQSATRRMKELIGISDAALAGAPTPGVTATESANKQQGAATTYESDAEHYLTAFKTILKAVVFMVIEEMEEAREVVMDDGLVVQVNPEDARLLRMTVDINTEAMSYVMPWQQGLIETLRGMPTANQQEVDNYVAEAIGLSESWRERIFRPQPQAMGAPGQQPGPPVDPVPMTPDGRPMLQVVGQ